VPHPLAEALIERLQSRPKGRVLDFASGSGRNTQALRRAGLMVTAIADDAAATEKPLAGVTDRFAAAISTHGLLHGTPPIIAARLRSIAERLDAEGLLYATFGSTRDARFGEGRRIDDATFAPTDGDERGVAHAYFDRDRLRALLEPDFEVESLEERCVDEVAGSWAHRERPLSGATHWFAIARKR
jgi:hypothetical protein